MATVPEVFMVFGALIEMTGVSEGVEAAKAELIRLSVVASEPLI